MKNNHSEGMLTRLSQGTKTQLGQYRAAVLPNLKRRVNKQLTMHTDYASNIFALTPTGKHSSVSIKHNQIQFDMFLILIKNVQILLISMKFAMANIL